MPLVLIVDDNAKNLKLAFAAEHLPDVVLLDLRLPDLDGTEVARELRERPRTARIPIVALTALPLGRDEDWLRAAGFAGCVEKPIDVLRFPEQVRRHCTDAGG